MLRGLPPSTPVPSHSHSLLISKHIVSFLCICPVFMLIQTQTYPYFPSFSIVFEKEFKRDRTGLVCSSGENTEVEKA